MTSTHFLCHQPLPSLSLLSVLGKTREHFHVPTLKSAINLAKTLKRVPVAIFWFVSSELAWRTGGVSRPVLLPPLSLSINCLFDRLIRKLALYVGGVFLGGNLTVLPHSSLKYTESKIITHNFAPYFATN